MKRPRIFVDMDGTLAEWKSLKIEEFEDVKYATKILYQTLRQPNYFYNLKPHMNMVDAVKTLINDGYDVYILSAFIPDSPAKQDKIRWLDKYLPEISDSHRIFVPDGENKTFYVPNGLNSHDYLVDDYSHNLKDWPDGQAIKFLNGINGTKGTWKGKTVSISSSVEVIANTIKSYIEERAVENVYEQER